MTKVSKGKNKGEWSELYAFLKILEDQTIAAADGDLKAIPEKYFVFKKIFRQENRVYSWDACNVIVETGEGQHINSVEREFIGESRVKIFEEIIAASGRAAFIVRSAAKIMNELDCISVNAASGSKSDIDAVIEDRVSNTESRLGFSVKSMVGGAATLLNASKDQTNFLYTVENISLDNLNQINSVQGRSKIRDRVDLIHQLGGEIKFRKMCSETFEKNARKIDTLLPEFLAEMLLGFYGTQANSLPDLVLHLANDKYLAQRFGLSFDDFAYKIQQFLASATLGMVPSKPWDGRTKAQGGYIVVKQDGEVVCYHLYNRDLFLEYLFSNTKFETPSSSRHGFGELFSDESGNVFLNLNLQIRFKK